MFGVAISTVSFDGLFDRFNDPKWLIFDIFTIGLIFFSIIKKLKLTISYLSGLLIVCIVYMFLSALWSPNAFESISFSLRFTCFVYSIYILATLFNKDLMLEFFIDCVFFSSLIFCIILIYQRYIAGIPYSYTSFSPIGFVNYLGQVLNIWIPVLVLSIYRHRSSKFRLILGLLSLFILMNLLVESGTRGTILGLLFAEITILIVLSVRTKKFPFKYIVVSVVLLSAIFSFSLLKELGGETLLRQINSIQKLDTGREDVFANTLDMIADNPMGVGSGNFQFIHAKYGKMGTSDSSPHISQYRAIISPYNIILKFYSELGLIFGSALFFVFLYCFFVAFNNFLKGNYIDIWIFMAVFSTSFHAMFSSVFLTPVSLFFSLILFSVVFSRAENNAALFKVEKKYLYLISFFLIFFIAVLRAAEASSNYLAVTGSKMGDVNGIEKSININPYNYKAFNRCSYLYLNKEVDYKSAVNCFERELEIYPYNVLTMISLARIYFKLGEFEKFELYKNKVLDIYPNNELVLSIK